jgi:hypothetical protein
MDWTQVLAIFAIMMTNLGTVVALYLNLDKKFEEQRKETLEIIRSIQQEMKDFHTKLAMQDLEFKMRLCAIEEKKC